MQSNVKQAKRQIRYERQIYGGRPRNPADVTTLHIVSFTIINLVTVGSAMIVNLEIVGSLVKCFTLTSSQGYKEYSVLSG